MTTGKRIRHKTVQPLKAGKPGKFFGEICISPIFPTLFYLNFLLQIFLRPFPFAFHILEVLPTRDW